jgi:AbrB family looped-hinge helix DNA binding protein
MEPIRERTRLSTRGQVVIPKLIRDQAELSAGDELTVIYDGETIVLVPTDHESASTVGDAEGSAKETNTEYRTAKAGLRV